MCVSRVSGSAAASRSELSLELPTATSSSNDEAENSEPLPGSSPARAAEKTT